MADILIFTGQSNMNGQTDEYRECSAIKNAFEYHLLTDSLRPLKDACGENLRLDYTRGVPFDRNDGNGWRAAHVLGQAIGSSLLPAFCKSYTERTSRTVVAVHAAKGAAAIADFAEGGSLYKAILKKARGARNREEAELGVKHVYMIWLQGESDALLDTGEAEYLRQLKAFIDACKRELGIERFGMIKVGRYTNDKRDDAIMRAQEAACAEGALCLMLTHAAPELTACAACMHPMVPGHFSTLGLDTLGEIAGNAMANYAVSETSEGKESLYHG